MNKSSGRLYNLLPAIYRIRDVDNGEPLRAILSVIENELQAIEKDIGDLYRNWFIETCDEWVVAYIGDLLGVRNLHPISSGNFSLRPYVANTLAYRRRKGTATVLEQLARDVTGWPARALEFFQLLSVTSHFNHVTLARGQILNLRDSKNLELLNSPFECAAYTADVRHISSNRGKYNIPNIGIFLWRLQSYTVTRGTAHAVSEPADGRYTFNPLGFDAPLFNQPHTETEITHLAEDINVPGVLRRRPLYDELEARRQALVDNQMPRSLYFDEQPVLELFINGQRDPIPSEQILICDLSDLPSSMGWQRPPPTKKYIHINTDGTADERLLPIKVAVDPKLGRLAFPMGDIPGQVEASYAYGFSGDIGGGPYNRSESISRTLTRPVTWQVGVSSELTPLPDIIFATLAEAVDAWNAQAPGITGVIAILDSHTYAEELTGGRSIKIPKDSQLIIVAADWPEVDDPDLPGRKKRIIGQLEPEGLRPHLLGNLSVEGTATNESLTPGELVLDGLLVEGKLTVLPGNLGKLRVAHCTLAPDHSYSGLVVEEVSGTQDQHKQNSQLSICIDRCICGPITLPGTVLELHIVDSIVDKIDGVSITAPGANTDIQMSTIFGSSSMRSLEASNSIFTGIVSVGRRQLGCMRFSYVPDNSQTPRRYYCQPDLALNGVISPTEKDNTRDRLAPSFMSMRYGDPAYAQLSQACALEILTGAEDGSEMGAFNNLKQSQREANLRASLDEYMRFGLEAGIFYVT